MLNVKNLPSDRLGRYAALSKELILATGNADRSEDNLDTLIKLLDVVAEHYGYNVVKKVPKRAKKA